MFLEMNHGPILVDNNILIGPNGLSNLSESSVFAHNLFVDCSFYYSPDPRQSAAYTPHTTIQHEKMLVENTVLNKTLLRKLLLVNAEKSIDWLKIRSLTSLILPLVLVIFIAIPRIQFTLKFDVVLGIVLFVSLSLLSYIWAIRVYLLIEKLIHTWIFRNRFYF